MAAIRFYTRSKVNKLASVYVSYQDGTKIKIRIITPFNIYPDYWSEKAQRLKPNILFTGELTRDQAKDIEDKFDQLKDRILRESFDLTEPPSAKWLNEVINKFYYKDTQKVETFREYFNRFYEEAKEGKRLAAVKGTKRVYAYETLRAMKGTKLSVEMFEDEAGRNSTFDEIDIAWYNAFTQFFYKRGCGANYIGRHIKTIKTVMRVARSEKLHHNTVFEEAGFDVTNEKVQAIYLTENEVRNMFEQDLSDRPHLARDRDVFLVGVFTAQRYSDYSRINKNMIKEADGVKYIELIQQKTGERCVIPIKPELDVILKRYDYTLPKTYEQKVNLHIKAVGAICKINDPVILETYKSGMRVKKTVKKHELIKTHTARRTGITNMYLAKIPPIDIMKISGHKTEREFLKYIRIGEDETASRLAIHPYFAGEKLKVVK